MVVDTKLYDILGVAEDADATTLKKSYRELVRKLHPDKGGDPEKFKEVDAAYKVPSDENLRNIYDCTGSIDPKTSGVNAPDIDILSHLFADLGLGLGGGSGGGFGGIPFMFGGGGGGNPFRTSARKTPDAIHELHLSLEAFYTGKVKSVNVKRNVLCKGCNGKGGSDPKQCTVCHGMGAVLVQQHNGPVIIQSQRQCHTCKAFGKIHTKDTMCKHCSGNGLVQEKTPVEVRIPPGVPNGYVITMKGMSDERVGHETGDLHFQLIEKSHDTFTRCSQDIMTKIAINLGTALLGGIVTFQHLDGKEMSITLPKGKVTRYGDTITISGKGMPNFNRVRDASGAFGDLRVSFHIVMPSDAWAIQANEAVVRRLLKDVV